MARRPGCRCRHAGFQGRDDTAFGGSGGTTWLQEGFAKEESVVFQKGGESPRAPSGMVPADCQDHGILSIIGIFSLLQGRGCRVGRRLSSVLVARMCCAFPTPFTKGHEHDQVDPVIAAWRHRHRCIAGYICSGYRGHSRCGRWQASAAVGRTGAGDGIGCGHFGNGIRGGHHASCRTGGARAGGIVEEKRGRGQISASQARGYKSVCMPSRRASALCSGR